MKYLAIFDIDGTITNTLNLDDKVYRNVLKELYNIELREEEWNNFKFIGSGTDTGIFKEVYNRYININTLEIELERFKYYFTHYLRVALFINENKVEEIAGVKKFLKELGKENK